MSEEIRKQRIYLASVDYLRRLLKSGVLDYAVIERWNQRNAASMNCKPVTLQMKGHLETRCPAL